MLHNLPLASKQAFLSFATGCARAPLGGLSSLDLLITPSPHGPSHLPLAQTCFNQLLLPEYRTRTQLRDKLTTAIENAAGFMYE